VRPVPLRGDADRHPRSASAFLEWLHRLPGSAAAFPVSWRWYSTPAEGYTRLISVHSALDYAFHEREHENG
jgi:hypothetical protein